MVKKTALNVVVYLCKNTANIVLANGMLDGSIPDGSTLTVSADEDGLLIAPEKQKKGKAA